MAAAAPSVLVDAILNAIQESGGQASLSSPIRAHPREFRVSHNGVGFSLWIYAWTATHGGKTRSDDEFRIQLTGVSSPLATNPHGPTILLGWEPKLNVFAGFDLQRHLTFSNKSPSVQISLRALIQALEIGISFSPKANDEVAVGFRPDQFLTYVQNASRFHGSSAPVQVLLEKVTSFQPVTEDELSAQPRERRRVVETVERLVRDAKFRDRILGAYGHRCAVSGVQLKLLDAAHILPVGAPGSVDAVTNGLALAPSYHRAFDRGLIFLDENYVMRVNTRKVQELTNENHHGGLAEFSTPLERKINLPALAQHHPSLDMIRAANIFRRIR